MKIATSEVHPTAMSGEFVDTIPENGQASGPITMHSVSIRMEKSVQVYLASFRT